MITINFRPKGVVVGRKPSSLSVIGTVLTIDGADYDLSELPDGATADHPVLGTVTRNGGDYECSIILRHGPNAPEETRFPEPISVTEDGPVELPPYGGGA